MAARVVQVAHFAGVSAGEPLGQMLRLVVVFRPRHAAEIETDGAGLFREPSGDRGVEHAAMMHQVPTAWLRYLHGTANGTLALVCGLDH